MSFGASPRASINMVLGAKALAFLRGRDYALPTDATELAKDVLRHRIVLSYEALADDVSPDDAARSAARLRSRSRRSSRGTAHAASR